MESLDYQRSNENISNQFFKYYELSYSDLKVFEQTNGQTNRQTDQ